LATAKAIKLSIKPEQQSRRKVSPIIIMVSAFSRDELLSQTDIDYVDLLLSKPITPSSLYDAVLGVLDKHESGQSRIKNLSRGEQKNRLSGVRILIVDDNDINLEIAKNILMLHGAVVNLAKNGREAIDWLLANHESTDIVLMDVQMPDMDGYDATRAIRQNPIITRLPVVALTAGAFTEDQEIAQAIGMDGFVAKPFNVEQLITVIQRLTGGQQENENKNRSDVLKITPLSLTTNESNNEEQRLPTIDFDEGIKRFGNENVFYTYLEKFENNYANAGHEISDLIQRGDIDKASALSHKLKGVAANLALKNVTKYATQIEVLLRTGGVENEADNLLQEAINQTCLVISALNSQKKAGADDNESNLKCETGEIGELKILLEQLLTELDKDSPSAAESALLPLKAKLSDDDFNSIKEQITVFDFQSAKDLTRNMILKYPLN
jgi:CheY-like chemotaxis protein/HPt (histidine-containing phosphotransfer) domain-containing protein